MYHSLLVRRHVDCLSTDGKPEKRNADVECDKQTFVVRSIIVDTLL